MNVRLSTILDIWSFKCKRFSDRRILNHKSRLCAHTVMHKWVINYWETYAPVVNWISLPTLLEITKINKLKLRSIDFVSAFPKDDLEVNLYMEFPIRIDAPYGWKKDYVLKLNKCFYGLKQASLNWFETVKAGFNSRYFEKLQVDQCFYIEKIQLCLCMLTTS